MLDLPGAVAVPDESVDAVAVPTQRRVAWHYGDPLGEQRRLEDLLDKQTQQTREVQRRLDQTNERLEALKAIERSLTSRPPAPKASGPTPAKRSNRNAAP